MTKRKRTKITYRIVLDVTAPWDLMLPPDEMRKPEELGLWIAQAPDVEVEIVSAEEHEP